MNSSGADQDNAQFGGMERDADLATEHAQFRNDAAAQGRWLSPDPALGSYDVTNPESFNRYPYALNNPTSFTDQAGREVCQACFGPGGGDDDDDDDDDGGWGGGGGGGGGSPTPPGTPLPRGNGPSRLDPNYDPGSLGESLGIPIGMPRGNWGPLAALGLPGETECEFGICGGGGFQMGGGPAIQQSANDTYALLFFRIPSRFPRPTVFKVTLPGTNYCGPGVAAVRLIGWTRYALTMTSVKRMLAYPSLTIFWLWQSRCYSRM